MLWLSGSLAACESAAAKPAEPELIIDCDTSCSEYGVFEGNAAISGQMAIDRYFLALLQLLRGAAIVTDDLQQRPARLRRLGLDAEGGDGALRERLTEKFALESELTWASAPATCVVASLDLGCETERDALCGAAASVRNDSELRCDPSPATWSYRASDTTPVAELEAFTFVTGQELALTFATSQRAAHLLEALERAEHALPAVAAAVEALPLPRTGPGAWKAMVGVGCALAELQRLSDVLDEQARPLQSALLDWAKLESALTAQGGDQ
jgi:hypothetical protein